MEELRIVELAQRSGVTVRNIRFYHQLGILPRPAMRGRVGWYGPAHVERLELIRRLADRGYSLAAVADMIEHQVPVILADEVDRSDPATSAWDGGHQARVTLAQLERMLPQLLTEPALLDRLLALGLLVPRPGAPPEFDVPQPPLLRAGIVLVARGVPVATVLDELERLRAELGAVAARFAGIVERDMLPARAGDGTPAPQAALQLAEQVWPPVLVAVGRVLTDAMQAAVLARLLGPDGGAGSTGSTGSVGTAASTEDAAPTGAEPPPVPDAMH